MKTQQIIKSAFTILLGISIGTAARAQMTDPSSDPHVESHIKVFLKAVNSGTGKQLEELSPADARAVLTGVQNSVKFDYSDITVTEKTITQDGSTIKINIVRPAKAKGILPVFMFFHGGGWVLGDFPTHKRMVHDMVIGSGAAAVFVNYTPSPEAHYPVAINQAYAATKWVALHGKEINVDGNKLAVAGNSVGGNMATVVAIMAKERKGPHIRFQALLWPVTNADLDDASYKEFATGHFLTRNNMIWYWNNYTMDLSARKEIYASPLLASLEQLKGLPDALVETADNDVLRDEGEAYARRLDEAGVKVIAVRYNGMVHDWGLINPLANVPETKAALLQAATEIKKALAK